jgi:dihydrofolate reductase
VGAGLAPPGGDDGAGPEPLIAAALAMSLAPLGRLNCGGRNSNRDPIERAPEMRKLIVSTFLTLDGVMQAPGGPEEDDGGGFGYGGWSVNYWDEQMEQAMGAAMSAPFDLVLGRKTYDIFAAYWPHAPEEAGGQPLNEATKYVASRGHPALGWRTSVLIEGDAAEGIAALKNKDGPELQVHGSGNLIQTLLRHNLIDQYRLWVFPLVIGSGKRLFADGTIPSGLRLVDSKVSTTGVVIGTYEPAGEIITGSFALD